MRGLIKRNTSRGYTLKGMPLNAGHARLRSFIEAAKPTVNSSGKNSWVALDYDDRSLFNVSGADEVLRLPEKVDPTDRKLVKDLIQALHNGWHERKVFAARALGLVRSGDDVGSAVDALIGALPDENPQVREEAARALGNIGATARKASGALIEMERNGDWRAYGGARANESALRALKSIGVDGREVPQLIRLARDHEGRFQADGLAEVLSIFENLGPDGKEALPYLEEQAKKTALTKGRVDYADNVYEDGYHPQSLYAKMALARIDPERTIPRLAKDLKADGDYRRFMDAVRVFRHLGPAAKAAVPGLISSLSGFGTEEVAGALGSMGPSAREAIPALIDAVSGAKPEIYWSEGKFGGYRRNARKLSAIIEAFSKILPGSVDAWRLIHDYGDDDEAMKRIRRWREIMALEN